MDEKIRVREKLSYTSGLLGQNMLYNFMAMYIMFFFTDLLGISAAVATAIIVIASLWDAVNDPLMGMVADKTRTRWGKFRPYLIFGPLILAVTTILCYVHFDLDSTATIIIAATCYILWGMAYTICDIPIWAISSVVSKNQNEKNKMVTLGKIGGTVGTAIVTVGSIMIINSFGGEREATAYTTTAIILTVVATIMMIITGLTLRERIFPKKEEVVPIRKNIQTITKNKPLIMLMIALLIVNLVNGIRQSVQMYFVVYVWGDSGQLTNVGISLIVGMILGMAITPKIIKMYDKKKIFFASCLFGAIACAIPFFVGGENILFGLIFLGISFFFTGVTSVVTVSMLIDAIDYSEWKLGFRGEGLVFSTNTFLTKLSSAMGRGIIGIGLILMQYTEGQAVTTTTQNGFSAMMYLIPAICFLLTMIPLYFFKISYEDKQKIQVMLEEKYSQRGA
ncbi:MFS transporter [Ornithinibacillus halophilus]|uniref:Sugar (Glycoside-Pentoside-Hexuronide) transporter n=1 Tax=Ornithinibacillus halophilus TaxID=930117 RepID=A0A1M5LHP4_9BACI|nr:glycoside-pentoside-hexuronide (GPH):cation symporter [Ornithinibacillus halophilus]SHG64486.1 sugar (Glycoside-Pentoside-Hexuronide) transporter [Ornithinibacillus halophilus]